MVTKYYVHADELGNIKGYYPSDIHQQIPEECIEITESQWVEAININANTYVNGVLLYSEPTPEPLTEEEMIEEQKAVGVEIQGHMISLNESNQLGLASISTMIDKAVLLGAPPFPVYPKLETKNGKVRLVANDQAEFDVIFLTFGLARQPFFN